MQTVQSSENTEGAPASNAAAILGGEPAPRGRDEVTEALLMSATRLFAESGIEGTSVREVAARAGVNHALVFRHFGSKAQLARTVLDRLLDELLRHLEGAGLDPKSLTALGEGVAQRDVLWKLLTRAVLDGEVDFVSERRFPEIDALVAGLERATASAPFTDRVSARMILLVILSGALGWELVDPVLAETVGTPGETPARRRELARSSFLSLLGLVPRDALRLTPEEVQPEPPRLASVPKPRPSVRVCDPPGDGPPRGRDQVVRALMEAAMPRLAARGPAAVSVREIANAAGVNHALVFRHFGSKEGLVQAVWERVAEDLASRVVGGPETPDLGAVVESIAEDRILWQLAARALLDGGADAIAAVRYHFVDAMVAAAASGQRGGLLPAEIPPRLLVGMVVATGLGFLVFHPVLEPLLGLPAQAPEQTRRDVREAIATLLGWPAPEGASA